MRWQRAGMLMTTGGRRGLVGERGMAALLAALGMLSFLASADPAPAADEFTLTVADHRFTPEEIKVSAGKPFVLVVANKDKTAEEFESHDLRIEKVVPAGKTVRISVKALKPGTYAFIGEFHEKTAKGRIVAE
jgi:hypothetical protein